ncbi:MAG TPA: squalene--hopene cyclase [Rhodanobacteraceae bacterium]|nr:squalene--hopene cyclase [Rhodanobacteraceae bacterium]
MAPDSGIPQHRLAERRAEAAARDRLIAAIDAARATILAQQRPDGCWQYQLEADCTIPAEYILMLHYLGESDRLLESRLAEYLRNHQSRDGGWPLYPGGALDVSCSVKCYYALKLAGDRPDAPHMAKARAAILAHGGAARSNVFTRIALALFGELPWRGVPFLPVEIVLLPRWFPFNLGKVSYWSRTVMVPLSVLTTLKPRAANPGSIHIRELFVRPPGQEKHYFHPRSLLNRVLFAGEEVVRHLERLIPKRVRRRALKHAEAWILGHRNGDGGLGAIFPAMVNAYEALALLGYPAEHPARRETRKAIDDLLVVRNHEAWCQPCVSPVWDTGLACLALQEDRDAPADAIRRALDWLASRQLRDEPGDWRDYRPALAGGGWAFQFRNDAYPDLDDTAVVARALHQSPDRTRFAETIERAADWLCGMQSRNGGFAAFDADNDHQWLNQIPFADHGALLDPPTSDVSGRVLMLLSLLDRASDHEARARVLRFLLDEQTPEGAWFGRWGTNYIYGTWSVLVALRANGMPSNEPAIQRAVKWLKSVQQADGGWGEGNDSYLNPELRGRGARSGPAQTAWALLALMSAGEADSPTVTRGVEYLLKTQVDGQWHDARFNAPGFPRVFYLKYHGYSRYFPYWALVRYRNVYAGRRH